MFRKIKRWFRRQRIINAILYKNNIDEITNALTKVGVSIRKADNTFKDTVEILTELSTQWNNVDYTKEIFDRKEIQNVRA